MTLNQDFAQLLESLRAKGFTDAMFTWLGGGDAAQWAARVKEVEGWLTSGKLTPEQLATLKSSGSYEAAKAFYEKTVPTTPAPTTPTTPTPEEQSAHDFILATLDQYGLGSLAEWAWAQWKAGTPVSQIFIDIRNRPEYKARFPAMEALGKSGHAITEQQYIEYERQMSQLMQQYGLPSGFYDQPDDFTRFLTNNIAPTEMRARLDAYQTAVWQSPPEVRAELDRLYGLSDGQLMAFFIDETKALPLIERDVAAAQAAGTSVRTGFGQLSLSQAEYLASQGFTQGQLDQGFSRLASMDQILAGLPGQNQAPISRQTAIDATFGANAEAQEMIARREGDLLAPFKGGGGPATTARGVVGAGVAQ